MSNTGQAVLSGAGAVLGAAIGSIVPGVGTAIGFQMRLGLGAAAGNYFFQTSLERQKANPFEARAMRSSYGVGMPRAWGTNRIFPRVIWKSDVRTVAGERHDGGKGGGGDQDQQDPDRHFVDIALLIADTKQTGPFTGFRKLMADSDVILDLSDDAGAAVLADSAKVENDSGFIINKGDTTYTFYTGTTDQPVDPTMEADLGVGNVSAYRNRCIIVIKNILITPFGPRIPNFSVEAVQSGTYADELREATADWDLGTIRIGRLFEFNDLLWAIGGRTSGASFPTDTTDNVQFTADGIEWVNWEQKLPVRMEDITVLEVLQGFVYIAGRQTSFDNRDQIWRTRDMESWDLIAEESTTVPWTDSMHGLSTQLNGKIYRCGVAAQFQREGGFWRSADGIYWDELVPSIPDGDPKTHLTHFFENTTDQLRDIVFWAQNGKLYIFYNGDADSPTVNKGVFESSDEGLTWTNVFTFDSRYDLQHISMPGVLVTEQNRIYLVFFDSDTSVNDFVLAFSDDATTWTFVTVPGLSDFVDEGMMASWRGALWFAGGTGNTKVAAWLGAVVDSGAVLSDVLSDIVEEGNLSSAFYDFSAATNTVDGFLLMEPGTPRSSIEELQLAFKADVVDFDYKINWLPRGGASIMNILSDDLGAYMDGSQPPPQMDRTRDHEQEMPRKVELIYISRTTNFEQGHQFSDDFGTQTVNNVSMQINVVLTDDVAIQVADTARIVAYAERTPIRWRTGRSSADGLRNFKKLVPGDVVTITDKEGVTQDVIIREVEDTLNGVLIYEGRSYDASAYTSNIIGGAMPPGLSLAAAIGPALLELLDIPIIRSDHKEPSIYMAAAGWYPAYKGARVYRSDDGGITYFPLEVLANSAIIGRTTDKLGDHVRFTSWDTVNTVNVELLPSSPGPLASAPNDLAIRNWANIYIIGRPGRWEVGQFFTPTLEADGTWTLSRHMRGRLGTEWAIDQHEVGDTFIMLNTQWIVHTPTTLSSVDQERLYKGVAYGTDIQDAFVKRFTFRGVGLKPWAPARLRGFHDGGANLVTSWKFRSRYEGTWRNRFDAPLTELTEEYEIDIHHDAISVVSTTPGNPLEIRANGHGLTSGDTVFVDGFEGTYRGIDEQLHIVTVIDINSFTIPVDGSSFGSFTGSPTIRRVLNTYTVTDAAFTYTSANQSADGVPDVNNIHIGVYQMSQDVGRGYPAFATL